MLPLQAMLEHAHPSAWLIYRACPRRGGSDLAGALAWVARHHPLHSAFSRPEPTACRVLRVQHQFGSPLPVSKRQKEV